MSGMTLDFGEFMGGLRKLIEESAPKEVARGMFKGANEWLHDAIYIQPKAPFDEGSLRGSARVQLPDGTMCGGGEVTPPTISLIPGSVIVMKAGFNIVYAARWHELSPAQDARINWTLPGSGRKYLESKMSMFGKKYMDIVGVYLKALLEG